MPTSSRWQPFFAFRFTCTTCPRKTCSGPVPGTPSAPRATPSSPIQTSVILPHGFGSVMSVGMALFGQFFYPFEVISLLLIAAMVGSVLLAKRSV